MSLAPERIFGPQAQAARQALALSAFTALGNAFFISFVGLAPTLPIGPWLIGSGLVALNFTLPLLRLRSPWQHERRLLRGLTMVLLSVTIYGVEIASGVQLVLRPTDTSALSLLLYLLLASYWLGLTRAWELLGAAHSRGLVAQLAGWALRSARRWAPHTPEEGAAATADGTQEQDAHQGQA